MLLIRSAAGKGRSLHTTCQRLSSAVVAAAKDDTVVTYPEIKDLSFKARKVETFADWHKEIENVGTVEEKMIKINMPRYWGYKVVDLGQKYPYNCLPATQHYTRTLFEPIVATQSNDNNNQSSNEKQNDAKDVNLSAASERLAKEVQESLEYVNDFFSRKYSEAQLDPTEREQLFTQLVVEHVNRALINVLSMDSSHLQEVDVDYNPRHEAFWYVGGIKPPKNVRKSKEGRDWQKEMANDPVDFRMQYKAEPYLAVRHRHRLPTWRTIDDAESATLAKEVPHYEFDPRSLGYAMSYRHGTNIPGFWPGNTSGFGLVSYQSRAHLLTHDQFKSVEDTQQALHAQAIQSSFAWLLAQANYNGFNTFSDLTYPMNTQTVITNGRTWSFYEYQMHTLLVHSGQVESNSRVNFCRGTAEMHLYERFDEQGKCIGLNTDVLQRLMEFYVKPLLDDASIELQPYLNADVKCIADYDDEQQRSFLENTFKHMAANRERHLARPEIYMWEKIYKIDNPTRQMEAKRRFFELDINPWKRTLDQHQKVYIPRALRPEGTKSKKKWKPTFYP